MSASSIMKSVKGSASFNSMLQVKISVKSEQGVSDTSDVVPWSTQLSEEYISDGGKGSGKQDF